MNPVSMLRAIAELATAEADGWSTYEQTAANLAAPLIPSQGGGPGRSPDVSDSVFAAVLSHAEMHDQLSRIQSALTSLRLVQSDMARTAKSHPETARAIDAELRAARCDGSQDPTCTRLAVRNIRGHSLCWSCIEAERDRYRAEGEAS